MSYSLLVLFHTIFPLQRSIDICLVLITGNSHERNMFIFNVNTTATITERIWISRTQIFVCIEDSTTAVCHATFEETFIIFRFFAILFFNLLLTRRVDMILLAIEQIWRRHWLIFLQFFLLKFVQLRWQFFLWRNSKTI